MLANGWYVSGTYTDTQINRQVNLIENIGGLPVGGAWPIMGQMTVSAWQRRIARAEELVGQHPFAAEVLRFYRHIARFQESLYRRLDEVLPQQDASSCSPLSSVELAELASSFPGFLSLAQAHGPNVLAGLCCELLASARNAELLNDAWSSPQLDGAAGLLAVAFLQPYAELLRSRATFGGGSRAYGVCPFCNRKPGFGVLRQRGEGSSRSLVCAFCLAEWEFRRLVCPGCGEENDRKLAVFTAEGFDYIRIDCCESCKTYLKTIDLTKNGRAEPLVDELASAPLDLWARDRGYAKLQNNLLGM